MTQTFAAPADAAEAIIREVLQIREDARRQAHDVSHHGGGAIQDMEHTLSAMREDAILRCLGHLLGVTDNASVDSYVMNWAAARGMDLGETSVRVRESPNASELYKRRAQAQLLDVLRETGDAGILKTKLLPLIGEADRSAWRGSSQWLEEWLGDGTVIARQRGRSTIYVHRDFAAPNVAHGLHPFGDVATDAS
ncbi:hypothetical protein OG618_08590 [Kitasatospora sp. NBC_01246]|uniref:hypothetical protein n=1 Tax=Kitasatospora sp. NBC_01246 TaxID=2903570 RepID=UPI002E328441|nr:hypothetical protein [Kitasatospora sp. NBC_01246]